jgi:hypothetical protein
MRRATVLHGGWTGRSRRATRHPIQLPALNYLGSRINPTTEPRAVVGLVVEDDVGGFEVPEHDITGV